MAQNRKKNTSILNLNLLLNGTASLSPNYFETFSKSNFDSEKFKNKSNRKKGGRMSMFVFKQSEKQQQLDYFPLFSVTVVLVKY